MATISNISSKYKDFISRSVLLHPGPPAVYQLGTKKENIGTLTKLTVGERNVNKINKTILLVGETGAGKSTLVNALVNYTMGVKWEDDVWFKIVEEEEEEEKEEEKEEEQEEKKGEKEEKMKEEEEKKVEGEENKEKKEKEKEVVEEEKEEKKKEEEEEKKEKEEDEDKKEEKSEEEEEQKKMEKKEEKKEDKKKEEKEKGSQTDSQTSDVVVYEVFGFEGETLPYSLTIIDTPGFGDTRGIEHDSIISESLLDLFRSDDGVHEVNAVGLVMKGSDNRLSDRLMYVFDSVMSLFGRNLEKNMVVLITHSDGRKPKNPLQALEAAEIKCSRNEENQPVHFLFDNCQHEDRTEEPEVLKGPYKLSVRGMRQFTAFLENTGPQKLKTTTEVLNERVRLTACIQNLEDRIKFIEGKQTEIRQTEEALKKYKEEMKKNKEFTVEVDEVYKEKEPIRGVKRLLVLYQGAVCCTVCEQNCHYPGCTMARKPEHCEVMKDGRCTSCTNKCPASDHVKDNWRYVTKTRRVKKTLEDMKQKYEENQTESEKKSSLLENLNKQMDQLTAEKSRWLDEAYQHVIRLKEIALKADSVSTCVHLDFLIEKMKEEGDTEKVQELEEMKNRMGEGTRAAMKYLVVSQQLVKKLGNMNESV